MIDQAIVLVGGRGTRLKSVVQDIPKPMALVNDKPFLDHLLSKLCREGIQHVVLAVGYKHEVIQDYFGDEFKNMRIQYSIEQEPLGTGGAIKKAFEQIDGPAFVFNGDAFFDVSLEKLFKKFDRTTMEIVIALKRDQDFDRYGNVVVDGEGRIKKFQEKGYCAAGTFNGGIYIIDPVIWDRIELGERFSFETDVMEAHVNERSFYAKAFDNYFIDIGIPTDYEKAQVDFPFINLDESWTIFLDRDGVINKLRPNDYVKSVEEFEFIEGSKEAIVSLSTLFSHVVVVTNQQGIGKKIMTEFDLDEVHDHLMDSVQDAGGRISRIYYCPELETDNPVCRKPNTGMAYQAQRDFPEIDFTKSIMIGDNETDIEFGKRLDMLLVKIGNEQPKKDVAVFSTLKEATQFIMLFMDQESSDE